MMSGGIRLVQDIETVKRACRVIGELSLEDKKLVCWITAADITQLEDKEHEDNSKADGTRDQHNGRTVD